MSGTNLVPKPGQVCLPDIPALKAPCLHRSPAKGSFQNHVKLDMIVRLRNGSGRITFQRHFLVCCCLLLVEVENTHLYCLVNYVVAGELCW